MQMKGGKCNEPANQRLQATGRDGLAAAKNRSALARRGSTMRYTEHGVVK